MEKKIAKWAEEGLIDNQTALKMLAEIKEDRTKAKNTRINITIYTVAAILIGLGVITFIEANDWIIELLNSCDLLKIILITLAALGSFLGGYKLRYENGNFPKLGSSLIVLSTLLIGATYALIGQVYHLNANSSFLIFLWLISVLPVAYLFKSFAVNILSILLLALSIIFFYLDLNLDNGLIWTIFIPIIFGTLLYSLGNIPMVLNKYNNFSLSYKIASAIPIFITFLILTCSAEESYNITSGYYIIPIVTLIILNITNYILQKTPNKLLEIETISITTILAFLLLLLVLPVVSVAFIILLANVFIIAMIIFGFNYGYKFEQERIVITTNRMLIIYLLVNYFRWGWSFMDKTLFFILGGTCLFIIGLYLEKKKKELIKKDEKH